MATVYVIWDRKSQSFVGGGQPQTYPVQADATAQATAMSSRSASHDKQPKPVFDTVAVTI